MPIEVLVIRINYQDRLVNSRPCSECINKMRNIKGYPISNVHYSNENGTITTSNLNELCSSHQHTSYYFRNRL